MPKRLDSEKTAATWDNENTSLLLKLTYEYAHSSGFKKPKKVHYVAWASKISEFMNLDETKRMTYDQVQSKYYRMKVDYADWRRLRSRTGAGIDPETGAITASNEWWADAIKVCLVNCV